MPETAGGHRHYHDRFQEGAGSRIQWECFRSAQYVRQRRTWQLRVPSFGRKRGDQLRLTQISREIRVRYPFALLRVRQTIGESWEREEGILCSDYRVRDALAILEISGIEVIKMMETEPSTGGAEARHRSGGVDGGNESPSA